ncbi:MAG: helix-turn-helix domain-containing protein [Bacteroidota bacterium]
MVSVKWLTVRQVSDYLQISVSKVYQMAQAGEIPCCRLGQQWRFEREEIDRWLRRTLKALDDLDR